MLIIRMLIGFIILFVMFCLIEVLINKDDAYSFCKIVFYIVSIIVLTVLAYYIGELFI